MKKIEELETGEKKKMNRVKGFAEEEKKRNLTAKKIPQRKSTTVTPIRGVHAQEREQVHQIGTEKRGGGDS